MEQGLTRQRALSRWHSWEGAGKDGAQSGTAWSSIARRGVATAQQVWLPSMPSCSVENGKPQGAALTASGLVQFVRAGTWPVAGWEQAWVKAQGGKTWLT